MDNSTQNDILLHLQKHGSITPMDALWEYGCYRLSSVINRLRRDHIITNRADRGKDQAREANAVRDLFVLGETR